MFPLEDVTAVSGISFQHDNGAAGQRHYVETMGPGLALFDAEGDGDLDVYVVDGGPLPGEAPREAAGNQLFLNRGDGTFQPSPDSGAEDRGYGMGVTVGDWNGDGDFDLYVLNYGPNVLLDNRGDGTFEVVDVGVDDPLWSVSGAFFDAEGDGDLDLYVANYLDYDVEVEKPCRAGELEIYCSPEQYPPVRDRFYRNEGERFVDATAEMGIPLGRGMGVAVGDLDEDGDFDLYVTNDRSQNFLFRNEGDGRYQEVAAEAGVGFSETGQTEGGMGVEIGDYFGDGRSAVFLTNFQREPNRLYTAAFAGFFDDRTNISGLGFPSLDMVGWGIASFDLEGDGDLDLAVANGHVFDNAADFIPGSAFELVDHLFVNGGSGRFELEELPGKIYSTRGLADGDLDGDGDPDLVSTACGGPLLVWRNLVGDGTPFLVLRLQDTGSNPFAFGARVEAQIDSRTLYREVAGGGSYGSHGDNRIYLGLGEARRIDRLVVHWPDGTSEELAALELGRDFEAGGETVLRRGEGLSSRTSGGAE